MIVLLPNAAINPVVVVRARVALTVGVRVAVRVVVALVAERATAERDATVLLVAARFITLEEVVRADTFLSADASARVVAVRDATVFWDAVRFTILALARVLRLAVSREPTERPLVFLLLDASPRDVTCSVRFEIWVRVLPRSETVRELDATERFVALLSSAYVSRVVTPANPGKDMIDIAKAISQLRIVNPFLGNECSKNVGSL